MSYKQYDDFMPITGDARTFARIRIDKPLDETLRLAEDVLIKTEPDHYEFDKEKNMFKGKTKFSWLKNTYGAGFTILIKRLDNQSIIDIYSNGWKGVKKPATNQLIEPFYKKLSDLILFRPEIDISVVYMSQEEMESTAHQTRTSNNASDSVTSVANEIAKLAKLKAEGIISEEEFTKMKYDLIDKM